jgi:hypothetical protein
MTLYPYQITFLLIHKGDSVKSVVKQIGASFFMIETPSHPAFQSEAVVLFFSNINSSGQGTLKAPFAYNILKNSYQKETPDHRRLMTNIGKNG